MMYCPNCGREVDASNFCPHCGGQLPQIGEQCAASSQGGPVPPSTPASPAGGTGGGSARSKTPLFIGIAVGIAAVIALVFVIGIVFGPRTSAPPAPEESSQAQPSQEATSEAANASASYTGSPFVREWKFESAIRDYGYVENAAGDGSTVRLVLADDGTGTLQIGSTEEPITWKPNGTLSVEKEELGDLTWNSEEFKLNTDEKNGERTLSVRNKSGKGTLYFSTTGAANTGTGTGTTSGTSSSAGSTTGATQGGTTPRSPKAIDEVSVDSQGRQLFSGTVKITTNAKRAKELNVHGFEGDDTRIALLIVDDLGAVGTARLSGDPDATKTEVIETIAMVYAGDWKSHDGEHVTVRAYADDLYYPSDIAGLLYTVSGKCELVK